ncbi:MAG: hypothetical protein OEZ38_14155 [Gammaproteobacteria bacterium]|nr:hypothetical protein [Gammaproteobacteria bacterium]
MWFKIKRTLAILALALLTDADMSVPAEWAQAYQQFQVTHNAS